MKSSRSLNKLLQEANDDLAILVTRTRQLGRLTGILRRQLEPNLAEHCYIGSLEAGRLVIVVDSASWATRLRFSGTELINRLRQAHPQFSEVAQIQVKILQTVITPEPPEYVRPSLSDRNAQGLHTLADSIDDPDLQAALNRLANRAK